MLPIRFPSNSAGVEAEIPWYDPTAAHPSRKMREGWGNHCIVSAREIKSPGARQGPQGLKPHVFGMALNAGLKARSSTAIESALVSPRSRAQFRARVIWTIANLIPIRIASVTGADAAVEERPFRAAMRSKNGCPLGPVVVLVVAQKHHRG